MAINVCKYMMDSGIQTRLFFYAKNGEGRDIIRVDKNEYFVAIKTSL